MCCAIQNDGTALHYAAFHGHMTIAQYLVEKCQAIITTQDKDGRTPISDAAEQGHTNIADYLKAHVMKMVMGIEPNTKHKQNIHTILSLHNTYTHTDQIFHNIQRTIQICIVNCCIPNLIDSTTHHIEEQSVTTNVLQFTTHMHTNAISSNSHINHIQSNALLLSASFIIILYMNTCKLHSCH